MSDNSLKNDLKDYKERIDITQYLTDQGYEIDKKRDSQKHRAYTNGDTGDKLYIPINKKYNNPSYYVNLHDPKDKGTVVDFVMSRKQTDLEGARQILKSYLGDSHSTNDSPVVTRAAKQSDKEDEAKKQRQMFIVTKIVEGESGANEAYLEKKLLGHDTRNHVAFQGAIKLNEAPDARFVAFPLKDEHGKVSGVAMKSPHKIRFLGNREGMWVSSPTRPGQPVDKVVITEDPVDAMSHHQLQGKSSQDNLVYMSPAGNPSAKQLEIAKNYIPTTGAKSVTLANDGDLAGMKYDQLYKDVLKDTGLPINIEKSNFKDWNADLFAQQMYRFRLMDSNNKNPQQADISNSIPAPAKVSDIVSSRDKKQYPSLADDKNISKYYMVRKVEGKDVEFSLSDVAYINRDRDLGKSVGVDIDKAYVAAQTSKSKSLSTDVEQDAKAIAIDPDRSSKGDRVEITVGKAHDSRAALRAATNHVDATLGPDPSLPPATNVSKVSSPSQADKNYSTLRDSYRQRLDGLSTEVGHQPDGQRLQRQLNYLKDYPHLKEEEVKKFVESESVIQSNQMGKGLSSGKQREQSL